MLQGFEACELSNLNLSAKLASFDKADSTMPRQRKFEDDEILAVCARVVTEGRTVSVRTVMKEVGGNSRRISELVAAFSARRFEDLVARNQQLTIENQFFKDERSTIATTMDRLEDQLKAALEAFEAELRSRLDVEDELEEARQALKATHLIIDVLKQSRQTTSMDMRPGIDVNSLT